MSKQPEARILLVDDDEAKRYTIAKPLERAGFELVQAACGADALRLVASFPDLVILDVKLPDLSGFEVCRRIKSDPNTSSIPVLHISSTFVDIEDKVHGLDCGADGYLTSVAEPLELIATVRALLRARKAEDAASLSTRQWQTTFDAISDGAMLLDSSGMVVQVNRTVERILECPWVELIGHDIASLFGESENPQESLFSKMLASRDREATDLSLGTRWLHVTLDPVRDAAGNIKGALCLISDITDRKSMETQLLRQAERLQEASQRKDEFLAMLAHELRNPLAPLAHTLEIIHRQTKGNQLIEDAVVVAKRQIQHMSRLLEDLLDVSRITRGTVDLRKRPLDFNTIVGHAVETTLPLFEAHKHELAVALAKAPLIVNGDPTRLEQIVSNLLTNAAKYTEPGGQINVSLAAEDRRAVLKVKDNGIGISPDLRHQIFDLFVQADHSLDRAHGGLGIGLTLVRSLVELHGGEISVHSAGPGQGSEFTLRIPLVDVVAGETLVTASEEPRPPRRPMRILVADDNRDSARTLARVLELRGDEVFCTFDGPSTIEFVNHNAPDAVLLDIGLPGMDGYQVAEQLRRQWSSDRLKLIAVTGYGGDADLRRGRNSGFDHYLLKPLDLDNLAKVLSASRASR